MLCWTFTRVCAQVAQFIKFVDLVLLMVPVWFRQQLLVVYQAEVSADLGESLSVHLLQIFDFGVRALIA